MDEKANPPPTKPFNFKQWLTKSKLNAVENVFRENKMTTMETLSMHNTNLSKLLSDQRICGNSKLVSKLILALQTLTNQNTKCHPATYSNHQSTKSENNPIPAIEHKLNDINSLEKHLKKMEIKYEKVKKGQSEYLKKCKRKCLADLNKSKQQITQTFCTIFQNLKQKEHSLLNELEKYNIHQLNEEKSTANTDIFAEKYRANQLIIDDCKTYIKQQLNILVVLVENADNICNYSSKMQQICANIDHIYQLQMARFAQNEREMLEEINSVLSNQFNINSVSFKLNESLFANMLESIDKVGEILRYKKLEIDIKKVEWTDIAHIDIYYEFANIVTPSDNSANYKNINIQQYEIQYRYFDINMSENDAKFEWKSVLFPSRSISNNKMVANNPISIGIEAICNHTQNKSDNETLFFIKMRVRHNPYYLWSNYSSTYKRKAANFLVIAEKQTICLKLAQKKRKRGYRRKSYASGSLNSANNSLNGTNSHRRQSSVDLSDICDNADYYHQYYTFDNVFIHENGCLTIDTNVNPSTQSHDSLQSPTEKLKGYLHIVIHRDLVISRGGKITVSGLGYAGGTRYTSGDSVNSFGELGETGKNKGGGGGSKTYELGCGGGGSYGGLGECGCSGKGFGFSMHNKTKYRKDIDGEGGCCYGDGVLSVCHFGSGGGGGDYGDSKGGNGGGIVIIECKGKLVMAESSEICANGERGKYDSDGCGSGGSVFVKCGSLSMKGSAKIEAIGGKNGLRGHGGNGGCGRIRIKCSDKSVQFNKYQVVPRPHLG